MSERRFDRTYTVAPENLAIPTDSASIARGEHLVVAITKCAYCHGDQLQGKAVIDAPPMGRLVAPNLTSGAGGVGGKLSVADLERAIRHGVDTTGRPLRIMPAFDFQHISDTDLVQMIAYLRTIPPVDNEMQPSDLSILPRVLLVTNQLPMLSAEVVNQTSGTVTSPAPGPTTEYGEYLATIGGCRGCHGPTLSGGKVAEGDPSWPPAANLTPAGNIGNWSEADFVNTLRTGKRPDGSPLNNAMPWQPAGKMTDAEMHAVWTYLQSVPPKEFGGR